MPEATRSPEGHALCIFSRSMGPAEPSGASYVRPRERNSVQVQSRGVKTKEKKEHAAQRSASRDCFRSVPVAGVPTNLVQLLPLKAVREVEPCAGPSSELVDPRLPFTKNAKPPTSTSFACEGADRRALQ